MLKIALRSVAVATLAWAVVVGLAAVAPATPTGMLPAAARAGAVVPVEGQIITTRPGEPISYQLQVTAEEQNRPTLVFGVVSGRPSGVTLSPTGLITGTVARGGRWTMTYSVRNSATTDPAVQGTVDIVSNVLEPRPGVVAGGMTTCQVRNDGTALCSGDNDFGQLGVGDSQDRLRLTQIGEAGEWAQLSTSGLSTCGIKRTGTLWCWGQNMNGQLGIGDAGQRWTPQQVGTASSWTTVDVGWSTACGVASGSLFCWGGNSAGQLGTGDRQTRRSPARVGTMTTWSDVSVGGWHVCGTQTSGAASCWGRNDFGQLGTGTRTAMLRPTPIKATASFRQIDAGWSTTCAVSLAGALRCWGLNDQGQIGDGTKTLRLVPTAPSGAARTYRQVSLGDAFGCALDAQSAAYCWGGNRYGQLGTALASDSTSPVAVAGGRTFSTLSAGWMHACGASTANGGTNSGSTAVQCWGNNEQGQLNRGNRVNRGTPPGVAAPAARRKVRAADGQLVVTSFNVLGSQHTKPGGGAASYAPGRIRTEWSADSLKAGAADIVGFQELQHDQYRQLVAALGDTYTFYPENTTRNPKVVWQAVMWRTSEWELVRSEDVMIPMAGTTRPNSMVLLRNRASGRELWILNVHNSSKNTKERQRERNRAVKIEINKIKQQRAKKIPFVFLGDMNERKTVFCKVVGQTDLEAVSGGSVRGKKCSPPSVMRLDWLFHSPELTRRAHLFDRSPFVARITDHAMLSGTFGFVGA